MIDKRPIVVILGMHRSGTSLLTNLLNVLNVEVGNDLLPADQWNVAGYWELTGIYKTQDAILEKLNRRWDTLNGVLAFPDNWVNLPEISPLKDHLAGLLTKELDKTENLWCYKDPRTATLLPMWSEIFNRLNLFPIYVLAFRNPLEVAASLTKRNGFSNVHSQLLWLKTNLDALSYAGDKIRLVVEYEKWFTKREQQIEAVYEVLAPYIPFIRRDELFQICGSVIRTELYHEKTGSDGVILPCVSELYSHLTLAADQGKLPQDTTNILGEVQKQMDILSLWGQEFMEKSEATNHNPDQDLKKLKKSNPTFMLSTVNGDDYPPLPIITKSDHKKSARICIVSSEFIGPYRNGGIGTANTSLGVALADAGHDVTFLFTRGNESENKTIGYWISHYNKKGIRFVPLPDSTAPSEKSPSYLVTAYDVYLWLRNNGIFDVIHFHEMGGMSYYVSLAKRQGLAFTDSIICVGNHSSTHWIREANSEDITNLYDVEIDYIERQGVLLADISWSPSQYLFQWMKSKGWELPENCYVQPYILPRSARLAIDYKHAGKKRINEFVFFGRLETRKGVVLFCDAIDRLTSDKISEVKITFLGRHAIVDGQKSEDYIEVRARKWPWKWQIISNYDQPEAIRYLQEDGRLAVMASPVDNSPNTVYECLGARIPFIACNAGGIPELISEEDVESVCFPYNAHAMAERLRKVLIEGIDVARPAIDFCENERIWVSFHENLIHQKRDLRKEPPEIKQSAQPFISVCLTHFNRYKLLRQALDSLRSQTYPYFEVILVDDGSTSDTAISYLKSLEPEFRERNWKIICQDNRYLGNARNTGAGHSRGDYILFMDDDNYAKPHELSTFAEVAQRTNADILTSFMDIFAGDGPPDMRSTSCERWLYTGGDAASGVLKNVFGDANALIRRDAFFALGGFTEDYGVTHEDWEFFAKAVLTGYHLEVIPEALFWYRLSPDSMIRTTNGYKNRMRHMRPYLSNIDPKLRNILLLLHGQNIRMLESYRLEQDRKNAVNGAKHLLKVGEKLYAEGRTRDAIEVFMRLTEIVPENPDFWNNLAVALYSFGMRDNSLKCFKRAIAIDPGYQSSIENLRILQEVVT